jgi:hypothetical protein
MQQKARVFEVLTSECKTIWPSFCGIYCSLMPIIHYSDLMEFMEVNVYHFGHTMLKGYNTKFREVKKFGDNVHVCNCLDEASVFDLWRLVANRLNISETQNNLPQEHDLLYHSLSHGHVSPSTALKSSDVQRLVWYYQSGRWQFLPDIFIHTLFKEYKCCESGKHLGMTLHVPPDHLHFSNFPIDFYDNLPWYEGLRNIKRLQFHPDMLEKLRIVSISDKQGWVSLITEYKGISIEILSFICCDQCLQSDLNQEIALLAQCFLKEKAYQSNPDTFTSWSDKVNNLLQDNNYEWVLPCYSHQHYQSWSTCCDVYKTENVPQAIVELIQEHNIPVLEIDRVKYQLEQEPANKVSVDGNLWLKDSGFSKKYLIGKKVTKLLVLHAFEVLNDPNNLWLAERQNVLYYHMYEKLTDGPITSLRLGRIKNSFQHF